MSIEVLHKPLNPRNDSVPMWWDTVAKFQHAFRPGMVDSPKTIVWGKVDPKQHDWASYKDIFLVGGKYGYPICRNCLFKMFISSFPIGFGPFDEVNFSRMRSLQADKPVAWKVRVEDMRPAGPATSSRSVRSSIEERFSGEMWHLIPRPSASEMGAIDEAVLKALSPLSGKILWEARKGLCEYYGNAVWLSRACERLTDPSVVRDEYVNRTMKKITDAMLMMMGSLINGVLVNSDTARRKMALNMLDIVSPESFAIHDSLLMGVFDMLDRAMRNPNLDVMCKASLAAKLGREHGKQRPDAMGRAADVLFEAMAIVHGKFVGLDISNTDYHDRLEDYDAQMARLLGMYSQMSEGTRHPEGAKEFFASLRLNARTERVKTVADLFVNNASVPSYNLISSNFIHR